ncbi:MAG: hypothetical protein ACJAT1_000150 [Marivirga sp.]|jgi:hypothetical protein
MKKLFFATILVISAITSHAQVRFGFRIAPDLSFYRIQSSGDLYEIVSTEAAIKMQLGPTLDFPFRENHYFSTGLYFSTKQASIRLTNKFDGSENKEVFALQYIQVPISLKLYTDEVGLDKKVYFQFGTAIDFKTQGILEDNPVLNEVNFADLSALLAIGMEYRLGVNTKLFGGLFYNRGLLNNVKKSPISDDQAWRLNSDLLGLEIGVTF